VGKKIKKRLSWKKLKKAGVATMFIPGILLAWYVKTGRLDKIADREVEEFRKGQCTKL